jgi:hypothetical protein
MITNRYFNDWGNRGRLRFTKESLLLRDLRSATTIAKRKSRNPPTLPKLKCLEEEQLDGGA